MRRGARLAVVAALLATAGAGVGSARPGKVVKVERDRGQPPRQVSVCVVMFGGAHFTCFVGDTKVSDKLHVISPTGGYDRVEVYSRSPSAIDSCGIGIPYDIDVNSVQNRAQDSMAIGGIDVVPGSRLIVSNQVKAPVPGVDVALAIDIDASGGPELLLTSRQCPETQSGDRRLSGKTVMQSLCFAVWERSSGRWRKNNESVIHLCQ